MSEALTNAVLVGREDLSARYSILRVRPDSLPIAEFRAGQFIQLGLPRPARPKPGDLPPLEAGGGQVAGAPVAPAPPPRMRIDRRSYSIASSPRERDHYEFFLTVVPQGRLTPELWKLAPGARCWVDDKAVGAFTLETVPAGADLVMVGTGTGIAPYLSMLREAGGAPAWKSFALVHGVRLAEDLGYRAELEARARSDSRFRYHPIASREPEGSGWKGARGRVQSIVQGLALDPARTHVFLCGNPDMIQSVREMLAPRGFVADAPQAPGNLHVEKYW
jgi:ferredoxin--NADP+ reductase